MLSTLTPLHDLRKVWPHEEYDFATWIAQEEPLKILSDTLGLNIVEPQTEYSIGAFRLDILATEEDSESKVIIENQLESTNHDHLGKIITYASGVNAKYIIWIVKYAREEHVQALEWLNENTAEELYFFLVEIKLYRIGKSLPAPKFEVVVQPNNWLRLVTKATKKEASIREELRYHFWTQFREYCTQNSTLKPNRAGYKHYLNIPLSKHNTKITTHFGKDYVGVCFYTHNKLLFAQIEEHKTQIRSTLGERLQWYNDPNKKHAKIVLLKKVAPEVIEGKQWDKLNEWLLKNAENFAAVFKEYI